jgi:protoporphyrinogen oxidase
VKVIVVGAGCAGLSAAYTLQKAGIEVTVFEASDVYGGRCRNVDEGGYRFAAGAGMTEPQWHTTAEYIREFGLTAVTVPKQTYGFKAAGSLHYVMIGGTFREKLAFIPQYLDFLREAFPAKTYPQLARIGLKIWRQMRRVDTKSHDYEALRQVSGISTEDYVRQHGGQEAVDYVFHSYLATMVLARPSDISFAHPLALLSLMKGMKVIVGGMGELTRGLYERVRKNVRLATPVEEIVIKDGRATGVRIADGFVAADEVICAVDAHDALRLMPGLPSHIRRALGTCGYSSTFGYKFIVEEDLDLNPNVLAVMIPAPVDSILSTIFVSKVGDVWRVAPFTRGWRDAELLPMDDDARRAQVIAEIQRFIPDFPAEPAYTKVFRWDRAVNLEAPGQFTAVRDLIENHADDVPGLHLAGEYLFLVACTEGALLTGKQAADTIVAKALTQP